MALDLSALEEKPVVVAAQPSGKPLEIPLSDIEEDPEQPRKEFTPEAMQEMTDSIRMRGVKTPVSVRSHPSKPGKWMLNYGARRYRGALAAGRSTIPAFVDEAHDDYDQVVENVQRDDLKPMELALFIKKRLDAGDQKKTIAKNLGKDGAIITQHIALIDPPACIEDAYRNGRCMSPKTLYELRGLYEKFPEQVEVWCADTVEITRKTVADLAEELKGKKKAVPPVADESGSLKAAAGVSPGESVELGESGNASKFGHDQILSGTNEGRREPDDAGEYENGGTTPDNKKGREVAGEDNETGAMTSWPKGRAVSDPDRMTKPLLLVEYDGREAAVLLNRRPSTAGLIHIRFEDGVEQEVDAGACKINLLTDAEK